MADELFLARYRGLPCEICGETHVMYQNRRTRSMGHHLAEKKLHRVHRYNPENIVVLCATHHGQHCRVISPHSDDTVAVAAFYEWLRIHKPVQWEWLKQHGRDVWGSEWTYKQKYLELGGSITGDLKKDQKPSNHAEAIRITEQSKGETK